MDREGLWLACSLQTVDFENIVEMPEPSVGPNPYKYMVFWPRRSSGADASRNVLESESISFLARAIVALPSKIRIVAAVVSICRTTTWCIRGDQDHGSDKGADDKKGDRDDQRSVKSLAVVISHAHLQ